MKITIEQKSSIAVGAFGALAAQLALGLEGRKTWLSFNRLRFETSRENVNRILELWPDAVVEDKREAAAANEAFDVGPEVKPDAVPEFVLEPRDFQLENFSRFKDQNQWAIFSVQGSGKTKVAYDIISHRYLKGTVTGVIVLSSPKGVHGQWVEEQLPKHLWPSVDVLAYVWEGKKPPFWLEKPTPELQIISGNIDMLKGNGLKLLEAFAQKHRDRLLVLVDESDSIKNLNSVRSKKLRKLASVTQQRAIMTGTPIAKDLTDEWAQFYFLNPDIIGHKYLTSFRAQYCIMGGFENRSVVGHRNVEKFKKLTAPYIFRANKEDLNLPPKIYDDVVFDLASDQKRLIRELRDSFFASLSANASVAVKNGATALMRIQQISNGFAVDEDGTIHHLSNPRLDALISLRKSIAGPVIIWCRFQEDIKIVKQHFHNSGVTYFGETKGADRAAAKEAFLSGQATEFIATAGAAGKGVDGLQTVCSDSVYYSNSYNAIDRWQSEDRIDRIGMNGSSSHFDLIARGSIDRAILNNLKRKKSISDLALNDITQIMEQIE